jgi:hypothetical protein
MYSWQWLSNAISPTHPIVELEAKTFGWKHNSRKLFLVFCEHEHRNFFRITDLSIRATACPAGPPRMFVLCWINCINIGWCSFIQLNSDVHLHNLLFWSTFSGRRVLCTTHREHPESYSDNLLLNFHYITHWFYHSLCKWNCGRAFSAGWL